MKNKLLLTTLTVLLVIIVGGCGSSNSADAHSIPYEKIEPAQAEENQVEKVNQAELENENAAGEENAFAETAMTKEENPAAEAAMNEEEKAVTGAEATEEGNAITEAAESTDLTFADLAKRQFEFSSGAGGWWEEFTIEKDGYFTGYYQDSDMGSTGEGYDGGTIYCSSYSGHFTDLIKVNDYTYKMKLADISYKETDDTEEIKDNVLYIYTGSYCLGGTDTFTIYLPGTPLDELSEEVRMWLSLNNQSENELNMIAIVDETNEYGIYSYDRLSPLEDAQMTFNKYKDSYDYYGNMLSEASTTPEMVEYTGRMYEMSDECLNYIWNLIRYNVDEEKYNEILTEQRVWIAEKEAKAEADREEFGGGTFAPVIYNDTLATLTMERCEELIEYLK